MDVIEQQKRDYTLTPLSSLNPLLRNPGIEVEVGGLGVDYVQLLSRG
jgi:hypothetical protein